ncbi:hypothetical protein K505DRAFT_242965, partial [Melanomma pulvis-pyrius CBS 109.77]
CDTCRARKVRCDRNDPCGNCLDGNIKCCRTPAASRRAQPAKRQRSAESKPITHTSFKKYELEVNQSPATLSASVPHSPSIVEAHDFIQRELNTSVHMEASRLAVLNSAMSFVNHLSHITKPSAPVISQGSSDGDRLDGITYPSIELLYWILREMKGNNMGPYVLDYFKHVSPKSLRTMGLALMNRDGDPETLLLSSICANSVAFKFINTILSDDQPEGMDSGLRACADRHLESIQIAMNRIHLLATPSMLFLQALLCSAFISQGTGDSVSCWTFISTACKVCEDLGLEKKVEACQNELDMEEQEVYYCFTWCHILDKNYSMMLGRSRCLLDHAGLDSVFSSTINRTMSSLLYTYLQFVPIQAIFISELHPTRILNNQSLIPRVEFVVVDLLRRMEDIHAQISKLRGPSNSWGGLYVGSELSTVEFSYHTLLTSILGSRQICSPRRPYVDKDYLDSARLAMSTLRAIQVEASSYITDVRAHVSTVLYHPLTPFFVLFCHVVATSSEHDFQMLKQIASGLDGLTHLSPSIAKVQNLFNSFIELSEGVVVSGPGKLTTPGVGLETRPQIEGATQQPVSRMDVEGPSFPGNDQISMSLELPMDNMIANLDPVWGLFDAQPTLDWLDADFSSL